MRKNLFLYSAIGAAGLFAASCGGSKHSQSSKKQGTWQAQPVVIDGANNDWPSPYPLYDSKAKIGYAASNDRDNLYITMQTGDRQTIMKILRNGLTVWIDTSGRKSQQMSINYPVENTEMPTRTGKEEGEMEKADMAMRRQRMVDNARNMSLNGFAGCNGDFLVKQANNCGIVVRIGFDEYNTLIWEASVPLKAIYKPQLTAADAGKPVSICFAIKGMKQPKQDENGGNAGGGMRGGGGMSGGGMGGGMRGGGGGMRGGGGRGGAMGRNSDGTSREDLFESTRTWYQTGLAVQ
ncbi:hypothetical protein ACTHGU_11905 [Chitinophagaceae bacterium MMS25-I14]